MIYVLKKGTINSSPGLSGVPIAGILPVETIISDCDPRND